MRHRVRGRKLGRNASHRKAMFRNMAASLIRSLREAEDPDLPNTPLVGGRVVTTLAKAKEIRPFVEKLVTLAKKAKLHERNAEQYATTAERGTDAWQQWRDGEEWQKWNQARAPYVAMRRRAFSKLRDEEAVDILFDELAERFEDRPGGYTRVIRLATRRLGDAGQQAFIEFVGEDDRRTRTGRRRVAPTVVADKPAPVDDEEPEEKATEETDPQEVTESEPVPGGDEDDAAVPDQDPAQTLQDGDRRADETSAEK